MKIWKAIAVLGLVAGGIALDRNFDIAGRVNQTATQLISATRAAAKSTADAGGPAAPLLRKVRIVQPKPGAAKFTLTLPGRTAPVEQARLSARAAGIVAERHGEIGDKVKAGDVLVVIDAPEVRQSLERARATVEQVEARLALAKLTLERAEKLVPKKFLPEQTRDDRRAAVDVAQADLAAAKAEVRRLEEILKFQTLRVPFDAVILARQVERGDRVSGDAGAAGTYLYHVGRLDELRVEIDVPQSHALKVKPGTAAKMSFAELPGRSFEAKVARTSQAVDAASSTMRAELVMENKDLALPAGLNGQVQLDVERDGACVLIPGNALVVQQGNQLVAVAQADDTIAFRSVALGRDLGNEVEVCSGLGASDRVIMSPNALLKAGDKVEVMQPSG